MTHKLLTPEQAADLLQVSKRTMYEWLRNGEIPCERIGDRLIRVRETDILSPDARTFFEQGCKLAHHPETVERAAEFFNKAIALNPRYMLAYFQLGTMFYEWSHFGRAIEPLKKAIELNASFPAYMNLGMNCNRAGWFKDAGQALRKAVELEPTNADAHHELGVSLMMSSFHDKEGMLEAVQHFRQAIDNGSGHELSADFLGRSLVLHLRDFAAAAAFADEIQERFPNTAEQIRFLIKLNSRN